MADNPLSTWTPPEAKTTSKVIKYGLMAIAGIGAIYLWNGFAPNLVTAIGLLDDVLNNGTKALWSFGGLLLSLWLFFEIFSKNGHINKVLNLYYWHLINSVTRFFITIDPMSPIDERITSLRNDQSTFEANSERVDGLMNSIKMKMIDCQEKAKDAANKGAAAQRLGKTAAQQVCAHDYGEYTKAAKSYGDMYTHLQPLSNTLRQISEACGVTIQKLLTERSILKDKWEMQGRLAAATSAAGKILGKSKDAVWQMADQAEEVISGKYGEELGHLEHLKNYAEPLMESIDLDNATYNEQMLAAVTGSGQKMIASTAATPLPMPQIGQTASNDFSSFLNK